MNYVIAISEHERKQIMGHSKSDTFDRNYLSQHVRRDVQRLYQGQEEHPVVRTAAQMSTYMDPRAPYKLSTEQRAQLKHQPEIVRLRELKSFWSKEVRAKYGLLKKGTGTEMHDNYERARLDLQAEERAQDTAMKVRLRNEYFRTIHTQTLDRQLAGAVNNLQYKQPQENSTSIRSVFPERTRVADAFFFSKDPFNEEDLLTRRFNIISDLAALCSLRELPVRRKSHSPVRREITKESDVEMFIDPTLFPLKISSKQCLFCLGDIELSYEDRVRHFSRADSLRRHVDEVHLCHFKANDRCPHPACDAVFEGVMQFKNHAATVHGIKLSLSLLDNREVAWRCEVGEVDMARACATEHHLSRQL